MQINSLNNYFYVGKKQDFCTENMRMYSWNDDAPQIWIFAAYSYFILKDCEVCAVGWAEWILCWCLGNFDRISHNILGLFNRENKKCLQSDTKQ